MKRLFAAIVLSITVCCASLIATPNSTIESAERTYHVRQMVTLSEIPVGTKDVKWWISVPSDDRFQDVLDLSVVALPGEWKTVREPDRGNRFLFTEVSNPSAGQLTATIEYTVRRKSFFVEIDPSQVGSITDAHRRLFADELRTDAPHMEVSSSIRAMAEKLCGNEVNVYIEAKHLLDGVADYADHYSKDPSKPKYSVGDAASCVTNAGGTCTDMHSLFIALARARGIPTRLQMGYRLNATNVGKEIDPGYRCWVEYFIPGYGWIPADIVEADAPNGLGRARWFTGLTERRVWLNEGREFDLGGRSVAGKRVNTMIIGYAEIDGVEARVLPEGEKKAQLSRKVLFTEKAPVEAALATK